MKETQNKVFISGSSSAAVFGIRTKGRGTRRVAGTAGCLRNLSLSQRAFVEAAFGNAILRPLSWILMFCSKTKRFLFWKVSLGVKLTLKPFWFIWKLSRRCDGNVFSALKMFSAEERAATPVSTALTVPVGMKLRFWWQILCSLPRRLWLRGASQSAFLLLWFLLSAGYFFSCLWWFWQHR